MLQTNNTGVCSQCLSHTESAPPFMARVASLPNCSGSRLFHWEPSVAGPGLPALPRSKPLGFRHSGSPQSADSRLGLCFVPFPDPSSSGDEVFGAHDCCDLSPPCRSVIEMCTGAPSQADVDHPGPQEVLVSKEACLQFYR